MTTIQQLMRVECQLAYGSGLHTEQEYEDFMESTNAGKTDGSGAPKSFRVTVHPDKCIGAGHCVTCAPDIFGQNDDDGVVILLVERPPLDRLGDVESAVSMCPTGVIEIHKDN